MYAMQVKIKTTSLIITLFILLKNTYGENISFTPSTSPIPGTKNNELEIEPKPQNIHHTQYSLDVTSPSPTASQENVSVSASPVTLDIVSTVAYLQTGLPNTTFIDNADIEERPIIGNGNPSYKESLSIQKALDWLKEKRSADYSWGNDTHMVILAKELSVNRESSELDSHVQIISELENLLSVKQMEIEVLTLLDRRHKLQQPSPERLAKYILAMGTLCKDVRNFHKHDLVELLQHYSIEPLQDQEFALTALASCSASTHVRKRQIRRLLDIASGEVNNVDTIAMVLLALRCIVTDHRHRHLQHFVRGPARALANLQGPKGGFGSLRSTALAMQALQDLEMEHVHMQNQYQAQPIAGAWNRTAASEFILSKQKTDGGWTEEPLKDGQAPTIGIGLTSDIILALGFKGLGAVRELQCDGQMREISGDQTDNGDKIAAPVAVSSGFNGEENEPRNVSYTYTLWIGTNVSEEFNLTLVSPKNTSFFRAMIQAAEIDSRFNFEAREWPNGHYVHTLAGKKEEPKGYDYWLLYRLPEIPDKRNPPGNQLIAPLGVDELLVEDGEHYLYWYKKL